MANNQGPFGDIFKAWNDVSKFCEIPEITNIDWDKGIDQYRSNIQAVADASKSATEGAQAIARRQVEIAQKSAEDATKFIKETVASSGSPESNIARQAEYTQASIESAVAHSREMAEMASKAANEAIDLLNSRFSDALNEWTKASSSLAPKAANSASKKKNAA